MLSLLIGSSLLSGAISGDLPDCQIYSENKCNGNEIVTDPNFESHRWFTPRRGDKDYIESYQDYAFLAGHAHLTYDSSRSSASVEILTSQNGNATLSYYFDNVLQSSSVKVYSTSTTQPVNVR